MLLFSHVSACLYYFITIIENKDNNWIIDNQDIIGNKNHYIVSFYWAISTICTVGFGDIHSVTIVEKWFNIIWIIIGVGFYSYIIGTLSSLMNNQESKKSIITARFSFLHEYAQEKNLSKDLLEKITNNLEFLEESNLFMDYQNPSSFMNDLSLNLTFELAKSVYTTMIEKILFFQENDLNFIAKLFPFITWRKFKTGENIYKVLLFFKINFI